MAHRFAIISDTHFVVREPGHLEKSWWNRVLEPECAEIGASLVRTLNALAPDFVVHCGDLTGDCSAASWALAAAIMDRLDCPWYAVPGNHDTWFPGVRGALAARYALPDERCHYSRDLAGLRFLFLDVAYWFTRDGRVLPCLDRDLYDAGQIAGMGPSPSELAWIEQALAAADRPVVVVSHAPLGFRADYAVVTLPRGARPSAARMSLADLMGDVVGRARLRALLRQYPRVRLALAGHWHISDVTREDGVTFGQTPALREYPFEFRLATVAGDRIHISTRGLDDASFRRRSYVEAWGNAWVAGAEADRSFVVTL